MRFEGFVGPAYQSASLKADAQDCLNLFVEVMDSGNGSKVPKALYGTPGLKLFTTLPETPLRGLWPGEQRLFAAAGSHLYEIFADGTYNNRGSIGNDNLPVFIAPNGNQLGVASNQQFYCDNGSGPVAINFSDGGMGPVPAKQVVYFDGYFVVQNYPGNSVPNTTLAGKSFFLSNVLDGTTFQSLMYASKEAYPDNLTAILADHEEMYLFGSEESSEVWIDTGALNFPLQRAQEGMMHYGCCAPYTPVRLNKGVAWLGMDQKRGGPFAIYAEGFNPVRVSTHAIEEKWSSYSTFTDAISYSYMENGHMFWVINFPTANATWCYDATTGFWHRRGWWNGSGIDRQRVLYHAYVGLVAHGGVGPLAPQHYGADWQNGKIYTVSTAWLDDAGTAIQRQRTCPHIASPDDLNWNYYQRFWLDSQVLDANMTLELANGYDTSGNLTFAPAWNPSSVNTDATSNNARTIWRRLGKARTATFRLTSTPGVGIPQQWTGAYVDLRKGTM